MGIKTSNLSPAGIIDEFLGHANVGGLMVSRRVGASDVAAQLLSNSGLSAAGGNLIFRNTKAALTAYAGDAEAGWVIADDDDDNNGIYTKSGAVWIRAADLPYSFVMLTAGGTANAVTCTTTTPWPGRPGSAIGIFFPVSANTAAVTLKIGKRATKPLLSLTGAILDAGYLQPGQPVAFVDTGTSYRIFIDTNSAANLQLAEAAKAAALTAKAQAETAYNGSLAAKLAAENARDIAVAAKAQALLATESGAVTAWFNTYADASAALGTIASNAVVGVFSDETTSGHQVLYRKEAGALAKKIDFTTRVQDTIGSYTGLTLDMFATPELGIAFAAAAGWGIRGVPGTTYTFNTGITITNRPLFIDLWGCTIIRGIGVANNQPLIRVNHDFSAATYGASDNIVAYSDVSYDFGNGPTFVPRLTLGSVAGYSVGQIVKVMSSDKIPSIAPWTDMRYAEQAEIGSIDVANKYIYLLRPFAEVWMPVKVCRLSSYAVNMHGGEWADQPGYNVARNAPMILVRGAVRPKARNMHFRDTASIGLQWVSCYENTSLGNRYDRPRHAPDYQAYSYGEFALRCTRPHQAMATGSGCRHLFDTGGINVLDADLNNAPPDNMGGTVEAMVVGGLASDSLNAPFNDHPDAFRTRIISCISRFTNRRSQDATLWGVQIRGRGSSVEGGEFEAITPIHVEPSTSIPNEIIGVKAIKNRFNETDVSRGALIEVDGSGVIGGGRANVVIRPAAVHQKNGRKEIVEAINANIRFEGDVKYDASLSNPVFAKLTNSELTIDRLRVDFSGSGAGATSPTLTLMTDALSEVKGIGLVHVTDSPAAGSQLTLTDFSNLGGKARWLNVVHEGAGLLYDNNSGWKNAGNAALKWSRFQRLQDDRPPNDMTVNFSSGSGAKSIPASTWATGRGEPVIYVDVNPTTNGTYVGTIPDGSFVGQRLILNNVAGAFSFAIQTYGNISVAASRTIAPGTAGSLRWSGTQWVG